MKYFALALLLISFVGISIFGLAIFNNNMSHQPNTGCAASLIEGAICPTDSILLVEHHMSLWQSLTTTLIPSISSLVLLIAFLVLISFPIILLTDDLIYLRLTVLPQRLRELLFSAQKIRQRIASWLSLFEHSPSFS